MAWRQRKRGYQREKVALKAKITALKSASMGEK